MKPVGTSEQEIRKEVVKALGEACKSSSASVCYDALKELKKIKEKVFQ